MTRMKMRLMEIMVAGGGKEDRIVISTCKKRKEYSNVFWSRI